VHVATALSGVRPEELADWHATEPVATASLASSGEAQGQAGEHAPHPPRRAAARLFNERAGEPARSFFGCVTTGEDWQFRLLDGSEVQISQ